MSADLSLLWLEITGKCQLQCVHCYSDSGPLGTHGRMTLIDWLRVIDQGADLGVIQVQFIGGEPTLHPGLPGLIRHGLARKLEVEVFSNLARVTPEMWSVFSQPRVRLATSYYSADAATHNAVTGRRSHDRTLAGIREAVTRSIPLRVGLIDLLEGQDVEGSVAELMALGVKDITIDHMRGVGRGIRDTAPDVDQLCGHCASGKLAVSPSGEVWPCIMSRWLSVGNVKESSLAATHAQADRVREGLRIAFIRAGRPPCTPADGGQPPQPCGPSTNPCTPMIACAPWHHQPR